MRVSEAGLALIQRAGADGGGEYLTQWNEKWQRYSLVGGHVEPGETYRSCCVREVGEELELPAGEYGVAPEPVCPRLRYTAVSGATGEETEYKVELYAVELLTAEARAKVDADPANRWLSEPEIRQHATAADRRPVSAQVETVLVKAQVLPVKEE